MNIKKISFPVNILIFGLLFTSSFPALILSDNFEQVNSFLRYNLYIGSLFIRETFIFLLGLKLIFLFIDKIISKKIKYKIIYIFLPIIPILILMIFDLNIVLLATGIRFYILFSLPLLVIEENKINNFKKNIRINDFIIYFYFILNVTTLILGKNDFGGMTFLGPRYSFIYESPNLAAAQFCVFLLYFNFKLIIEKKAINKTKIFILSILLFTLTLFTGGRAGLILSALAFLSTSIIYFFPNYKYVFETPKKIKTKFYTIFILFLSSLFFLVISSNQIFSGRNQTGRLIEKRGLISGIYGSRFEIINEILDEPNTVDLITGKPGLGTNTACNQVTSSLASEECRKTDSLPVSSFLSFGIIGLGLYFFIFIKFINFSYSPLIPISFLVFSFSYVIPELVLPWTQLTLILLFSVQKSKINLLEKLKNE